MYRGKMTKVVLLSKKFCILWYRHTKTCRESNRTIALVLFLVQILPTQWTISFHFCDQIMKKKIVNQYVLGALVIIQYHITHLSLKVYFQLDRNPPQKDPELSGGITYRSQPGNAFGYPGRKWRTLLQAGRCGILCLACS